MRHQASDVVVVVAVDDELGAVPRQHGLQRRRRPQAARAAGLARQRRMVDQHEAEEAGAPEPVEHAGRCARSCAAPTRPEAISGGVGTAELTPISATRPSMRT